MRAAMITQAIHAGFDNVIFAISRAMGSKKPMPKNNRTVWDWLPFKRLWMNDREDANTEERPKQEPPKRFDEMTQQEVSDHMYRFAEAIGAVPKDANDT